MVAPGRYRHYKGGFYQLLFEATAEDTMNPLVVYRSEVDGRIWVRSREMWNSAVHDEASDGTAIRVPRFERVSD